MNIVQVIDSLEVGGAERMAVNYANALSNRIAFSGLVATRNEGSLKSQLDRKVSYEFLAKKSTVDFKAARRLRDYCKLNKVDLIHAHSTSYFIALLVKLLHPRIGIIWHDHNGMSEFIGSRKPVALKMASFFFKGIIVVNAKLRKWAMDELHTRKVIYIPNFTNFQNAGSSETELKGNPGKRILCLANLREQKNHVFLVEIAERIISKYPDWSFHLVGKDFNDEYSARVRHLIENKKLGSSVLLYGSRNDTSVIIDHCDIGILTSRSEGLPVSLLEYGFHKMPVVVTGVGEIPEIVINGQNGFIVPSGQVDEFVKAITSLIESDELRSQLGMALNQTVASRHSEEAVMEIYLNWLKKL
ncbi:MAG TPA: glycosyltransferase family 4 protein [Flavobacterium sp.]|jgi:glycosyltransferase involved in cell wall biosynthesis